MQKLNTAITDIPIALGAEIIKIGAQTRSESIQQILQPPSNQILINPRHPSKHITSPPETIHHARSIHPFMEPLVGAKDASLPHRHQEGHHRRHHQSLGTPHIKDITGVRRCGKTTILYQVAEHLTSQGVRAKDMIFLKESLLIYELPIFSFKLKMLFKQTLAGLQKPSFSLNSGGGILKFTTGRAGMAMKLILW